MLVAFTILKNFRIIMENPNKVHLKNMYKIFIVFFLQISIGFGQLSGNCFELLKPYAYDVGEKIMFTDSTFKYEFMMGLLGGVVQGSYSILNDTVILNSNYQADQYNLEKQYDSLFSNNEICLKIKQIEHSQILEVSYLSIDDSLTSVTGEIAHRTKFDSMSNFFGDTIINEYLIPRGEMKTDVIEVNIWRKNTSIPINVDEVHNIYFLNLTEYPNELDYRFFKDKKLVIRNSELIFLDKDNLPEKDYIPIMKRKGIKMSKKKKTIVYSKCSQHKKH